jgi:antitoxin (DNA-binding transcriptional repressor) of toxin-antitoxin stability system
VKYTVHQAKTSLSRLLKEACAGKEVVIARGSQPIAKLVPLGSASQNRIPGRLKGLISWTADAFDPLTDQELSDLGFE